METRTYYATVFKAGSQLMIKVPVPSIAVPMGIEPRDEVKIEITRTGKKVERTRKAPKNPFQKKDSAEPELAKVEV